MTEKDAITEVLSEVRLLRSDMAWIRKEIDGQTSNVVEIFSRLKDLEIDVASIKSKSSRGNIGLTVTSVLIAALVAIIALINAVNLP